MTRTHWLALLVAAPLLAYVVLLVAEACLTKDVADKSLEAYVTAMSARGSHALNADFMFEGVKRTPAGIVHQYSFLGEVPADLATPQFRDRWVKTFALPACMQSTARLLREQVRMDYFFRSGAGQQVTHSLTDKVCEEIGSPFEDANPYRGAFDPAIEIFLRSQILSEPERSARRVARTNEEAQRREISVTAVLAEGKAREIWHAELFQADNSKEQTLHLARMAATASVGFVWIAGLVAGRRVIADTLRHQWRKRSLAFRGWCFVSFFWASGVVMYVVLINPYRFDDEIERELLHMVGVMLLPPIFVGAFWFGFRRFVLTA